MKTKCLCLWVAAMLFSLGAKAQDTVWSTRTVVDTVYHTRIDTTYVRVVDSTAIKPATEVSYSMTFDSASIR